jgi:uncharacterized protein
MKSAWQVTQEMKTLPQLKNPLFIEGLPGIGNVGKIAVDFLVDELKAKKLYSFFSYKFPHSVFVSNNNLIEMPKVELYYKKSTGNRRDLLFLTGDIQPIDEESCYTFCEEILKIVKIFNCSEIITTGGIGLQDMPEKTKIYVTGNNEKLLNSYLKKDLLTEKDIFGVVGPIVGVSGVLLGLGNMQNVKGVALLAETFGHPMHLGVKGAKEILRVLNKKFTLNLNIKKLNKEISEVEKEILKKTKEWASEMLHSTPAGAKAKNKEVNYIG